MSEMCGKIVACDRCGAQVFLRCAGEGEADGGFTRWNKFEPFPDGWEHRYDMGRLCPACNKEYEKFINSFMGGGNNG